MSKHDDYPAIVAWGRMMGSRPYYVEDEIERARRDGAPRLATFRRIDPNTGATSGWAVLSEVTAPMTQLYFQENHPALYIEAFGAPAEAPT